jgi:hypothetical protein
MDPEFLKKIGFIILIIGLAGEIGVLFIPHRRWKLEKTLAVLFILIVIAGVTVERIGDARLAEMNGPRHLSDKQMSQLVDALKPFSGQIFQMITYPKCDECSNTFIMVYNALIRAGWVREGPPVGIPIGAMQSILVIVNDEADEHTKRAAAALVTFLYGSPEISGQECVFISGHGSIAGTTYRAGEAAAQATAQSERTRRLLVANRFHAISQASMMSAMLRNTELASQWLRR